MDRLAVYSLKRSPGQLVLVLSEPSLETIGTVVAAPLVPAGEFPAEAILNPQLQLGRDKFVLITEQLAAISLKDLGKQVTTCVDYEYPIANAINRLFFGI